MSQGGVLSSATMASTIVRVADVEKTVAWWRDVVGVEALHVGADGEHKIAAISVAGAVISLWQLPAGVERSRDDNETNSYLVFVMTEDIAPIQAELAARGADVTDVRFSDHNTFFWLHDLDGNRFEVARPTTEYGEAALPEAQSG